MLWRSNLTGLPAPECRLLVVDPCSFVLNLDERVVQLLAGKRGQFGKLAEHLFALVVTHHGHVLGHPGRASLA